MLGWGGFRLGATRRLSNDSVQEAAEAAKNADLAIVCVGTNADWEGEGHDRKHMHLPAGSDELVRAVVKANPKTIVVNQSGCKYPGH
jgi:beta-glucosidase